MKFESIEIPYCMAVGIVGIVLIISGNLIGLVGPLPLVMKAIYP